jgi:two-component system, chemotaxis family, sensor kinase CheA
MRTTMNNPEQASEQQDKDENLALFVAECTQLLDTLEAHLMQLERSPNDRAVLDTMFRLVHTIKGNATVVQQGEVEWFAHIAESVLSRLRDSVLVADGELISVLLACCDHLRFLLGMAGLDELASPEFADADRARLIGMLVPYLGSDQTTPIPDFSEAAIESEKTAKDCWHLQVSFAPEVLREGMDPAYFLRHLESVGRIFSLKTSIDEIPAAANYDPELCYLSFNVLLDTAVDKQAIEDVFDFVRDRCSLQLTAPQAQLDAYVERIQALPADDLHTGEILMRVGAITPAELDSGLRAQRNLAKDGVAIGRILVDEGFVSPVLVSAVLERQDKVKTEQMRESRLLHISAQQLDRLISEIDQLQASVRALVQRGAPLSSSEFEGVCVGLDEVRTQAENMRSTRFGELFRRLHRTVRDAAHDLGKRAELRLTGDELILARGSADLLADVFMHLLRNAVDHGLESPAERQQAGKPAHGTLTIQGVQEDGCQRFVVSDDGAGIDTDKVRALAIERGLLPLGAQADKESLFTLLFEPGFSTAGAVTVYSGRGVGLDVVRDAVMSMSGKISVSSKPGEGSCFEILIPCLSSEAE